MRGSYVDGDLLRGFNFEPFAGKIDDSTWVENLGPKSETAPTVHLVTSYYPELVLITHRHLPVVIPRHDIQVISSAESPPNLRCGGEDSVRITTGCSVFAGSCFDWRPRIEAFQKNSGRQRDTNRQGVTRQFPVHVPYLSTHFVFTCLRNKDGLSRGAGALPTGGFLLPGDGRARHVALCHNCDPQQMGTRPNFGLHTQRCVV